MIHHRLLNSLRLQSLIAILAFAGACAQSAIRPIVRTADKDLPRPARILVYDFAIGKAHVSEYGGILRQQPSNPNPAERQREIGRIAGDVLAVNLVAKLRRLGFAVEQVRRGVAAEKDDLIIDGRLVSVDEGSPLRRLVIGFGSGASTMTARVQVFSAGQRLLEFATHADSGGLPGAAATVPVSAAAPFAVGVGLSAGSAIAANVNGNSSSVDRMAAASADQATRYLSEFFAKQGWIRGDQIQKARIAY